MDDLVVPKFESAKDEIEFWKKKYKDKARELKEVEDTFTEFQDSSKDLEAEMEKELQRNEKQLKDVTSQYMRLKQEHEEALDKSRRVADESTKMVHSLQDELEKLKKLRVDLQKEKTRLEQENDNLERRERELTATVQDLTEKVNKLMEENAWLQTELEEQSVHSQELIQRSKEELRDLKLEMTLTTDHVARRSSADLGAAGVSLGTSPVNGSGSLNGSGNTSPTSATTANGGTTTGSGRVPYMRKLKKGSIGLVDDMLNMVKDMEKRLQLPLSSVHGELLQAGSPPPLLSLSIDEIPLTEQTAY